ncbi:MAG: 3-alpha-hydroxysteroid dehydrogenase, partial [Acidimicrobiia bacterium]
MRDVLGYEGKRVIVTGAASGTGAATAMILVDLGVEVHAI